MIAEDKREGKDLKLLSFTSSHSSPGGGSSRNVVHLFSFSFLISDRFGSPIFVAFVHGFRL